MLPFALCVVSHNTILGLGHWRFACNRAQCECYSYSLRQAPGVGNINWTVFLIVWLIPQPQSMVSQAHGSYRHHGIREFAGIAYCNV